MKKRIFIIFTIILLISNFSYAELENDQWRDSKSTYLDLIKDGYEIKAYDISNFNDSFGNMYMFFVTVLQKNSSVFECQEYQIFDENMNTIDLSFVCRELVQPYKKGLDT